MQGHHGCVDAIKHDISFVARHHSKQDLKQARFARASSTNNANLGENTQKLYAYVKGKKKYMVLNHTFSPAIVENPTTRREWGKPTLQR